MHGIVLATFSDPHKWPSESKLSESVCVRWAVCDTKERNRSGVHALGMHIPSTPLWRTRDDRLLHKENADRKHKLFGKSFHADFSRDFTFVVNAFYPKTHRHKHWSHRTFTHTDIHKHHTHTHTHPSDTSRKPLRNKIRFEWTLKSTKHVNSKLDSHSFTFFGCPSKRRFEI